MSVVASALVRTLKFMSQLLASTPDVIPIDVDSNFLSYPATLIVPVPILPKM